MPPVGPRPSDHTAVIVGGGIGGLTAALELRRAGFDVTVLERRDELAEVNTGFLLWSFAIRRLRALGLGERLAEIGTPVDRVVSRSWRGDTLGELDLTPLAERAGAPTCDVHRAGLQQLLAEAASDVTLRFGAHCTDVSQLEGSAAAHLDEGTSVTADLLIGADGAGSVTRRLIAGDVAVKRGDLAAWRGIARVGTDLIPEGLHLRVYGPFALFGAGRLDRRHVRWYAGGRMPQPAPQRGAERKAELLKRFGSWPDPVVAVLEATDPEAVLLNRGTLARPLRRWHTGRIGLLGDAAHTTLPTLAMGGAMAIEDAAVLGECVREQPDPRTALQHYEHHRRLRAAAIQAASLFFGGLLATRRERTIHARDLVLGSRFERVHVAAIQHLMQGR